MLKCIHAKESQILPVWPTHIPIKAQLHLICSPLSSRPFNAMIRAKRISRNFLSTFLFTNTVYWFFVFEIIKFLLDFCFSALLNVLWRCACTRIGRANGTQTLKVTRERSLPNNQPSVAAGHAANGCHQILVSNRRAHMRASKTASATLLSDAFKKVNGLFSMHCLFPFRKNKFHHIFSTNPCSPFPNFPEEQNSTVQFTI